LRCLHDAWAAEDVVQDTSAALCASRDTLTGHDAHLRILVWRGAQSRIEHL